MTAPAHSAAYALACCPPDVREELCLSALSHLWGIDPVLSFLDEDLQSDAAFWAATASPAVLAAYLPAIVDALEDACAGKSVRRWMIRAALAGLPDDVRKILLDELIPVRRHPRKPINKAYAATIERRKMTLKNTNPCAKGASTSGNAS